MAYGFASGDIPGGGDGDLAELWHRGHGLFWLSGCCEPGAACALGRKIVHPCCSFERVAMSPASDATIARGSPSDAAAYFDASTATLLEQ